ncbi:CoA pyrophosphatase [Wenyingzhuangia sp. 1_MG-2023]|nr:CoA pyrophosphatase [Wenyingzhuangia sp. 1_MG-2023]
MEFEQFLLKIEQLKKTPLPGISAHRELAPYQRPVFTEYNIPNDAKKAAVLVLFYPNKNTTNILLTQRAVYKGTHSNQISFPGGKKDLTDSTLKETALRETLEEVGVVKEQIDVLKQLSTIYIPQSNFSVNPYIGIATENPIFKTNYEVEQIIEFPVKVLLNPKNLATFPISTGKFKNIEVPCFQYQNHFIWGATAMILNEVKEVLKTLI